VFGGLQTGLINGVTVPPVLAIVLQWHTQVQYVLDLPLMYVYGLLTVSERQYRKLTADDQQLVAERMGRVVEEVNASSRRDHVQAIAVLKNLGLVWSSLSAEETGEWRSLADKASAALVTEGTVSAELVATMNTLLADYRARLD
jgi:TRAP-type C4-dicarboxylate transport system substrate-binding protein